MATMIPQTSFRTSPFLFVTSGRRPVAKPVSLVEAVQMVVQQIEEPWLQPVAARNASLAFCPRVMLAVLTYCYARQMYGTSEILRYLMQDEAFRKVCQSEFPNVREIETFRRQNRSVIERCLIFALRFLGEEKVATGFVTRINETFIAEEAKRRIIMAACTDSIAPDDDCFS